MTYLESLLFNIRYGDATASSQISVVNTFKLLSANILIAKYLFDECAHVCLMNLKVLKSKGSNPNQIIHYFGSDDDILSQFDLLAGSDW